jgi:hypothetical protein
MTALSMIMAVLAFALFGLATRDHHRKRFDIPLDPVRARQMRGGGWAALVLAFPPAILAQGWVFGPVLWLAGVMLGAGVVFLTLNFLPERKS